MNSRLNLEFDGKITHYSLFTINFSLFSSEKHVADARKTRQNGKTLP